MENKIAVGYVRVSTEEQATGTSPDTQRQYAEERAKREGWELLRVCEDIGISGTRYTSRPGIQEALSLIESGQAQVLIATKLDRIGRSTVAILDIVKRIRRVGAGVVLGDGYTFDDSPAGQFTLTIFAGAAQLERDTIRQRTMGGANARALSGIQPRRSRVAFGYTCPEGKYALSNQAPIAQEIFERYNRGESLRTISRWLNTKGVKTQFGGTCWRPSQLKKILVNSIYKGEATFGKHGREVEEVGDRQILHLTTRKDYITIPAPAVVTEELWNSVQERLSTARKECSGNPKRRFLLSGLLRCPKCGRGMTGERYDRTIEGRHFCGRDYHCPDQRPSRNTLGVVCDPTKYQADDAEALVIKGLTDFVNSPNLIADAIAAYRSIKAPVDPGAIKKAQADLTSLKAEERVVIEAQIEARMCGADSTYYAERLAEISKDRKAVEAQVEALQGYKPSDPVSDIEAARIAVKAAYIVLTSDCIPVAEKHDLLRTVIERIKPMTDGYIVELKTLEGKETVHSGKILCTVSGTRFEIQRAIGR